MSQSGMPRQRYCRDHSGFHTTAARPATDVLPWAIDPDLAEQLWRLGEKMTGVEFSS